MAYRMAIIDNSSVDRLLTQTNFSQEKLNHIIHSSAMQRYGQYKLSTRNAHFWPLHTETPQPIDTKIRKIYYIDKITWCAKIGEDRFGGRVAASPHMGAVVGSAC